MDGHFKTLKSLIQIYEHCSATWNFLASFWKHVLNLKLKKMLFVYVSSFLILTSQKINRSWHYCLNPENWYNHQTFVSRKLSNEGVRVRICLFYFGKLELSNNTRIHFKVSKLQSTWLTLPMDTILELLLLLPGPHKVQSLTSIGKETFEWNSFCLNIRYIMTKLCEPFCSQPLPVVYPRP